MPERDNFTDTESYYSTLFHELNHSTGHESRLSRREVAGKNHAFGSANYAKEELVAEMGAAFLCGHCHMGGNRVIENAASYIAGWSKKLKEDPKLAIMGASAAQKSVDFILGRKFEK